MDYILVIHDEMNCISMITSGGSSYRRGGGRRLPPTPPYQKFGAPLDRNFKLYMNHCHLYPVNIFVINMRNSLFRLLILFDMFDELQLIY